MTDFQPLSSSALAAIDLGSNSFRLEVGEVIGNSYRRELCQKSMVSLGAGLDAQGVLSREAIDRGIRCLQGFTVELAKLNPSHVRVVATQTLREAVNRDEFLHRAEAMLGLPVEVISGHEEARLIYAGVSFLHPSTRRRLVIDIGGRSTELIVGEGRKLDALESFRVGSASISQEFFAAGRMTAAAFRAAQLAVSSELAHALEPFSAEAWQEAMGASGTSGSISAVLKAYGITDGSLTPKGLRWMISRCIIAGRVDRLKLRGLKEKRRSVLPGGLAILYTLAMHCGIRSLQSAKGALRQGVIVDLHERRMAARRESSEALKMASALQP